MTTVPAPKRGRGRPRKFASAEEAAAATAARLAARREDEATRKRIAAADLNAAAQPPVQMLLVSVAQAAQALQVSQRTIHSLIADGHLQSIKILGTRRIDLDDLRRLAASGT